MSFPKLSWGREKHDLADRWPKGPDGTPEKPAFLADSTEEDNAAGMTVEMLRAYGIPVMKKYDDKDGTLADETVKAAVEKRQDDLEAQWSQYLPEQLELVQNYKLVTNGNYILFAVSEYADEAVTAFNTYTK